MKKSLAFLVSLLMIGSCAVFPVHAEDNRWAVSEIYELAENYIEENNLVIEARTILTDEEFPFLLLYYDIEKYPIPTNEPSVLQNYLRENGVPSWQIYYTWDENVIEKLVSFPEISTKLKAFVKENNLKAYVLSCEDGKSWFSRGAMPCIMVYCDENTHLETEKQVIAFMEENNIDSSLVDFGWDLGGFIEDAETILSSGDATGDGEVNILDVISLNKAVMGKETLTEEQLQAIDFNQNGKPDADEALTLLKYIVGLIENFTV